MSASEFNRVRANNWPLLIGWFTTGIWCVAWIIGVIWKGRSLVELSWNAVGDTLAGFAAPLAFLWLVVGYYLQREELKLQRSELSLQRAELRRQAEETAQQTKQLADQSVTIRQNEQHLRKDALFRLIEATKHDMAAHASTILNKLRGTFDPDSVIAERDLDQRTITQFLQGDADIFFRVLLQELSSPKRGKENKGLLGKLLVEDIGLRHSVAALITFKNHISLEARAAGDTNHLQIIMGTTSLFILCEHLDEVYKPTRNREKEESKH